MVANAAKVPFRPLDDNVLAKALGYLTWKRKFLSMARRFGAKHHFLGEEFQPTDLVPKQMDRMDAWDLLINHIEGRAATAILDAELVNHSMQMHCMPDRVGETHIPAR